MYEGGIDSDQVPRAIQDEEQIENAIRIFTEESPIMEMNDRGFNDRREWPKSIQATLFAGYMKALPEPYTNHAHLRSYGEGHRVFLPVGRYFN